jgi:hypothetical protein
MMIQTNILKTITIGLLVVLSIWGAYASVVLNEYGWADDFCCLYWASFSKYPTLGRVYYEAGRPIAALISKGLFGVSDTLEHLRWIRLVALGLTAVLGSLFVLQLRRAMPPWLVAGAVSLVIFSPAFGVHVGWASSIIALPSAILSMAGGIWLTNALQNEDRKILLPSVGACLLLLAALATYQPTACFFLIPPLIQLLGGKMGSRTYWWTLGAFLVTCGLYFLVFRTLAKVFGDPQSSVIQRGGMVSNLPERIVFMVREPLRYVFSSWSIFFGRRTRWIAMPVVILPLIALLLGWVRHGAHSEKWLRPLQWLLIGVAISSPLLVVNEPSAPFRTLGALHAFLALSVSAGVATVWNWLPGAARLGRVLIVTTWSAILLVNYMTTIYVINEGVVQPNARELSLYRNHLRRRFTAYPQEVVFVMANPELGWRLGRFLPFNEFGGYSSWVDWAPQGLLGSILNEEYHRTRQNSSHDARWGLIVHQVHTLAEANAFPNIPVIDANQVLAGF